jgi:hypothetical protein
MPHDVSSLLSCLYQFKSENSSLEKKFDELKHRRDSLRVTNANLRQKLSEILTITNSQSLPRTNQQVLKKSKSPIHDNQLKLTKITPSNMEFFPNNSTFSYEPINPYAIIKNERLPPTNGLSLELLSQILATNNPPLFAPTWNISVSHLISFNKQKSNIYFYRISVLQIFLGQVQYQFLMNQLYVHIHHLNNKFNLVFLEQILAIAFII